MIKLQVIAIVFGCLVTSIGFAANVSPKEIIVSYDALLIVDICPYDNDPYNKIRIPQFLRATDDAIAKRRPIVLVEFTYAPTHHTIMETLNRLPKDYPFKKITKDEFSAFAKTDLEDHLNRNDLKNIFIIGTSSMVCIRSTILEGIEHGFHFLTSSDFLDAGLPFIPDNLKFGFSGF